FGLFLPQFRDAFSLSTNQAGLFASAGFIAFLLALPLTVRLVGRSGPRMPVVVGAASACIGFLMIAAAGGALQLLAGVMFASASAGLCWAPFNDAAKRFVSRRSRASVLAVIASGTSIGIILAALMSLAVTYDVFTWRHAWGGFCLAAFAVALGALIEMPAPSRPGDRQPARESPKYLCRAGIPLYLAALCFGAANAVYFSFAADRVVEAGGLSGLRSGAGAGIIFLSYGAFGMLGTLTGRAEAKTGTGWLLRLIFAVAAISLGLIALAPQSWPGVVVSAGLQGAALMSASAIFSIWSLRLFPEHGTSGFVVALIALAVGSVLGPAIAGLVSTQLGPDMMFLLTSLPLLLVTFWPGKLASSRNMQ
ncbi:MAG: MFS transporter, partial [Henriciella sp.]|uniref:MFS transporter n=1 Tax=Henriciella sp. TaxID=1968823 RepID=UPI003C714C54